MRALAICAVCLALLGACASKSTPRSNSVTRPKSTATLKIIAPQSGQTLDKNNVVAKLDLSGGRLTKTVTTHITPNVGHMHLRLDGKTVTLLGSLSEKIPDVSAGQHILEAEFVAADHGPFDPRVLSTVSFTAK